MFKWGFLKMGLTCCFNCVAWLQVLSITTWLVLLERVDGSHHGSCMVCWCQSRTEHQS